MPDTAAPGPGPRAPKGEGRAIAPNDCTTKGDLVATILLVEDNVFIREVAEMIIQDLGHKTFSAGDEAEALLMLRSPQHLDALFTDIYLKEAVLGGCAVASEAHKLRPDLRILYTTGNSVTEKMRALFTAGSEFLLKPYSPKQLQDSVEHLLAV